MKIYLKLLPTFSSKKGASSSLMVSRINALVSTLFLLNFSLDNVPSSSKSATTREATLNDEKHSLDAYLAMDYTNNSPDTLDFIYFHLWPNAFSTTKTAFAKQKRQQGSLDFHFVKPSELGHIKKMAFSVEGKAAQW